MIPKGPGRSGIRSVLALCCLACLLAARDGFFERGEHGQQLPACNPQTSSRHVGHLIPANVATFLLNNGFCTLYIPEYNDVQRLWERLSVYGPIVWGFAQPELDAYTSHVRFDNQPVLVAVVHVDTTSLGLPTVYNKLGLSKGITHCVFLKHIHAVPPEKWDALIVPQQDSTCVFNEATGRHLPVVADRAGPPDAYPPPVTRFVESQRVVISGVINETLIGIRCGSDWCNIGTSDRATIPPPAHGVLSSAAPAQWRIKGWFDDQSLALVSPESQHGIKPLSHRASLVPDPKVVSYRIQHFQSGWRHVATVFWPPSDAEVPPKYFSAYGFQPGNNEIEIRLNNTSWEARIKNALYPDGLVRRVFRTPHPGFRVPATARWVWLDNDEEIWVKCDVGCCLVQGEGFQ